jgi:serine protease inhibitor
MKPQAAIATGLMTLLTIMSGLCSHSNAIAWGFDADLTQKSLNVAALPKQTQPQTQLVNANTQFGLKLFSAIAKVEGDRNIFVCPTSIAIALNLLYNGASGKTQQEMASVLSLGEIDLTTLNRANQSLLTNLQSADRNAKLAIANSLWAKQGIAFRHQFLKNNRQFYQAEVTSLNFNSAESPGIINRWVEEHTLGKIIQIVERINPDEVLFLINAVYFKGNWTNPFDKNLTAPQSFYLANGTAKQQLFMSASGSYLYYENQQLQAISLPYGNKRLSMYIFLPKKNSNLKAFLEQLNFNNWQQWRSQFKSQTGTIKLPRFKQEYEIELSKVLITLGLKTMFDSNKAEFANLTSQRVKVNSIRHKTFIEVNEEGSEAAAATSAPQASKPFTIIVDRPFFYAIRDEGTGTILFMGTGVEPKT